MLDGLRPRHWLPATVLIAASVFASSASAQDRKLSESVDGLVARFRSGWRPAKDHMRPVGDEGWKVRIEVLRGLARYGASAVPDLIRLLDHPESDVRSLAAQALAYQGDRRAVSRLQESLVGDGDATVRLYAADALGAIGGLRPSPILERAETADKNSDVRAHVRFALEREGRPLDEAVRAELGSFKSERIDSARIGKAAPDFRLEDATGKRYSLADYRGKRAVVLVFIYGDT